jgi:hypothetical protein
MTGNGERLRDNMHEFLYHRRVLILKRQMRLKGKQDLNFWIDITRMCIPYHLA